jgi:hypothetical protein
MSRIFKDKVSSACIDKDICNRQVRRSWIYEPFSTTVGLTYASGALTATWAKLRGDLVITASTERYPDRPQDHIEMCQDAIQ